MKNRLLIELMITLQLFFSIILAQDRMPEREYKQALNSSYTPLHIDEVRQANSFRFLIDILISRKIPDTNNFEDILKQAIKDYLEPCDKEMAQQLVNMLISDKNVLSECNYLYNIKRKWSLVSSRHFVFYFPAGRRPDNQIIDFWDNQYERLSKFFDTEIGNKILFIIDPDERFGRAFPPWDISAGIRQQALDNNPHELVHLMLFKYSDVPFFHEPLAFIYGTDLGNSDKYAQRFNKYIKVIAPDNFISSTALIHFPQIIGLDNKKWASAFCFIYELCYRYGTNKLLTLMRDNLWDGAIENYKTSFRKIYGFELKDFEDELKNNIGQIK